MKSIALLLGSLIQFTLNLFINHKIQKNIIFMSSMSSGVDSYNVFNDFVYEWLDSNKSCM